MCCSVERHDFFSLCFISFHHSDNDMFLRFNIIAPLQISKFSNSKSCQIEKLEDISVRPFRLSSTSKIRSISSCEKKRGTFFSFFLVVDYKNWVFSCKILLNRPVKKNNENLSVLLNRTCRPLRV